LKLEIRNSKIETNPKDQIQKQTDRNKVDEKQSSSYRQKVSSFAF